MSKWSSILDKICQGWRYINQVSVIIVEPIFVNVFLFFFCHIRKQDFFFRGQKLTSVDSDQTIGYKRREKLCTFTLSNCTLFENLPKCLIWIFEFWHFANFCPIKIDLSGNTVWPQASRFKKLSIFGIFNRLLSTQNVNVVRFAHNVEWDFFCDFQTPCNW